MWTELQPQTVPLTAEYAKRHASLPRLDGDRDWTSTNGKKRCAWLDAEMRKGEFFSPCWSIAIHEGKEYRIDGGHSSNTLATANGHFPKGKHVLLRRFVCETEEDLIALFQKFDNSKSNRTLNDKFRVIVSNHDELKDVSPSTASMIAYGILLYMNNGEAKRTEHEDKTGIVSMEREFAAFANEFARDKVVGRPGAVAAIYRGWRADPAKTVEFWRMVRDESHPEKDNPTRVLHRYLRAITADQRNDEKTGANVSTRAQYVKSIHAWNAWMKGYTTDLKYHDKSPIPEMFVVKAGKFVRAD